jgi:hypothetical protein
MAACEASSPETEFCFGSKVSLKKPENSGIPGLRAPRFAWFIWEGPAAKPHIRSFLGNFQIFQSIGTRCIGRDNETGLKAPVSVRLDSCRLAD